MKPPKTWEEKYYQMKALDIQLSWDMLGIHLKAAEKQWDLTAKYLKKLGEIKENK